jgi:hypothetical protein
VIDDLPPARARNNTWSIIGCLGIFVVLFTRHIFFHPVFSAGWSRPGNVDKQDAWKHCEKLIRAEYRNAPELRIPDMNLDDIENWVKPFQGGFLHRQTNRRWQLIRTGFRCQVDYWVGAGGRLRSCTLTINDDID